MKHRTLYSLHKSRLRRSRLAALLAAPILALSTAAPIFISHFAAADPVPPTVVTGGVEDSISPTTADGVWGTVNPNGLATTYQFQYGKTTGYGGFSPSTAASAGSGTTAVHVDAPTLTGLTTNHIYHFRLTATNSAGTTLGADLTFNTCSTNPCSAPTVGTASGSNVTSTTATFTTPVTPNGGVDTFCNYFYAATNGSDSGSTPAVDVGSSLTSVNYIANVSNLLPNTTYDFTPSCSNDTDTTNGTAGEITTSTTSVPIVTTGAASSITATSATVQGKASAPATQAMTCRFDYGKTLGYGGQTVVVNVTAGTVGQTISGFPSSLTPNSGYNYRLKCSTDGGSTYTYGSNATFTTLQTTSGAPIVSTGSASNVGSTSATLAGTGNPNGADSTCRFDYGKTLGYGGQTAVVNVPVSGGTVTVNGYPSGLTPGSLYNYRIKCTNANGTTLGSNATFTTTSATNNVTKVLTIVEENHSLSQMQSQMPYLNGLATQYGYANNYSAITHPSLPNYFAMAAGSTFGVNSDCTVSSCPQTGQTVFDQAIAASKTGKIYAEDMPSNCATTGSGLYAPRHTAWPYFTDTTSRANCNNYQVPSGTYTSGNFKTDVTNGALPNVGWLIPNLCNDAHNSGCTLAGADDWLHNILPVVFAGSDWQSGHLAIVVTGDENDGSSGNLVLTVVIHPDISGAVVTTALNHYSLTRLQEDVIGATHLNNAATAANMGTAFGLTVGP